MNELARMKECRGKGKGMGMERGKGLFFAGRGICVKDG